MVFKKVNKNLDEKIVWLLCFFALFILVTTELLSLIKLIIPQTIYISWLIFIITIIFVKNKITHSNFKYVTNFTKLDNLNKFCLYFVIIIFIISFVTCVIYPPNTPDAMSYHMPRVMQWIQNQEVSFFPTSVTRQLYISPFSGYLILHLVLLFGGDLAANFAQWFAMVFSVIVTSFIIRLYVKNILASLIGMIFCATIPIGILQATSTQIDYMASLWLLVMVYFLIQYKIKSNFNFIVGFAISLSLAILSKQTSYIFSLPFCFYLLFLVLKKNKKDFFKLAIIPLILIVINFSHFKRNYDTFNNPIGINKNSKTVINEKIDLKNLSSNLVRNISLNLTLPSSEFNQAIRNIVYSYHDFFDINITSKETTFKNDYFIHFSLYETRASNTLHFILIIFCIYLGLFNSRRFNFPLAGYLLSLIFGFVLFSLILKWQPWGNRLLLPFFVMFSPIIGIYLHQLKKPKLNLIIVVFLSFYSIPYLLMNDIRPLFLKVTNDNHKISFDKPFFLSNKKEKLYFTYNNFLFYENYKITKNIFEKIKCKNIGIISKENTWEYPYWIMLKKYDNEINISHYDVKNPSQKLENFNSIVPCFVIEFNLNDEKSKSLDHLKNVKELDQIKIYY